MKSTPDDIITIIGLSYLQPVADLVDHLLQSVYHRPPESKTNQLKFKENGYAAACIVLLVALLESLTARVRFKRQSELKSILPIPDLLCQFFPKSPTNDVLCEVFLLRNIVIHNHVWQLDNSDQDTSEPPTLSSPTDLGFNVNKSYNQYVDSVARHTIKLKLNIIPTYVGVSDVSTVFRIVWSTLEHMNKVNYDHTPLTRRRVQFRGSLCDFESLQVCLSLADSAV